MATLAGVLLLSAPAPARAAAGDLTYSGCLSADLALGPAGSGACVLTPGATLGGLDSGVDVPTSLAVSPDGSDVYSTAASDDSIVALKRGPGGGLSWLMCLSGETASGPGGTGPCSGLPSATVDGTDSGLDAPVDLAISPDGTSLYAVASADDSIVGFRRQAGGQLAFPDCNSSETITGPGGTGACDLIPGATPGGNDSGFDSPAAVVVSPGGAQVYVAVAGDDAIATFARAANGDLTYSGCLSGSAITGPGGTNVCALIPTARPGGVGSGLARARGLALSPNGSHLYAIAADDSAVATFARGPGGGLTWQGCISGDKATGPAGTGACSLTPGATVGGSGSGLSGLQAIAAGPEGRSIYAGGESDDAVAALTRTPATGALGWGGCVSGSTSTGPGGSRACQLVPRPGSDSGLNDVEGLAVAPDGRTLYVAAAGNSAVSAIGRDPIDGTLAPSEVRCLSGDPDTGPASSGGSGACTPIPAAAPFGAGSGLGSARSLVLSPGGANLYASAGGDAAVASFAVEPFVPDTTAPALKLSGRKRQASRRKLVVKARCDESCTLVVTGKGKGKRGKKLKLSTARGDLSGGDKQRLKLKFKGKKTKRVVKRALRRGRTITIKLKGTATDGAGNKGKAKFTVKLKQG